jgi:hypothetical protein
VEAVEAGATLVAVEDEATTITLMNATNYLTLPHCVSILNANKNLL